MSQSVKLERPDEEFLVRAYLHKPDDYSNMASVDVIGDLEDHEKLDFGLFSRLESLGYSVTHTERVWHVGNRPIEVVIFKLTPLGKKKAEDLLGSRVKLSHIEKFKAAHWSMCMADYWASIPPSLLKRACFRAIASPSQLTW